jgi:PAS domain S-box-containing protein
MTQINKNNPLREGEFKALIENSLDVIMRFDRHLRHLYVNPLVEKQTGIPPDQFIGKTHAELGFPSHLVNLCDEALEKVFSTGTPNRVELQLPGGVWVDWMLVPEFSSDGVVETVITSARDITDRKKVEEDMAAVHRSLEARVEERTAELAGANQELRLEIAEREGAEEALRRSEETLRLIVEGSPGFFFYVHDAEGIIIYISPSVKSITGRSPEEWRAHYTTYLTDNPINKNVKDYTDRTLRGEKSRTSYSAEVEHADGRRIFLRLYERPIIKDGKVVGIQGVAQDITDRRQKEHELIRLSSALAGLAETVVITDLDHRIIYVNQASIELLGYRPEELIGKDSRKIFDAVPGNPANLTEQVRQGSVNGVWRGEIFDRKKDGTIISVALTMTGLKDEEGKDIGWVGISSDITEWKKAEAELRFLSSITRQVTDAIVVTGEDFKINYVNPAAEEMYGYTRGELLGKTPGIFNVDPKRDEIQQEIYRTVSTSRSWQGVILNQHQDGSTFFCECKISPLIDRRGEIMSYIGIMRDVTRQRQLEEQLRHAQKMEAIGTLAGGIAHDFNNILAGITGYAFLAKQRLERTNPIFSNLASIEKLSRRGSELTNALLAFSRRGEYKPVPVNINRIAKEVLEMIKRTRTGKIEIREELEENLSNIAGDEGLLHQVLLNLCINACDAMPEGGVLSLNTVRVSPNKVVSPLLAGTGVGDLIMIKISDTGIGMDIAMKSRIFEPFFTTKDDKTGTGLGLSIVNGIVEKHGGWIEVESTPGAGSEFTLYFPATMELESIPGEPGDSSKRGGENILVVDDDDDFRQVTCKAMEHFGYSVVEASSGEEALRKLKTGIIQVDLILLDIVMEGIGGVDTLRWIHENHPELPIIVISGYTIDHTSRQLIESGAREFISKPFEFDALAVTIREILDGDS